MTHEDWCDLLSTIEVKYNKKRAATKINKIKTLRATSHYDSNESIKVPCMKKARTGVLRKKQGGKPKHHGVQRYCVLFKKAGMPKKKYMPHSTGDFFGNHSNHKSVKDGLVIHLGNKDEAVKQFKKSKNKWKKELKSLKKQNKMLYSIAKKSGLRHKLNNIKNIKAKASNKRSYYSSNYYRDKYYSDSSLSINSD